MDHNHFRIGDFEYVFHAIRTPNGWTNWIIETNHGVAPAEERKIDGALEFADEAEALEFAEKHAHRLADSHFSQPPMRSPNRSS